MTAYGVTARAAADLAANPQFLAMIGHHHENDVERARTAADAMLRGEGDAGRDLARHASRMDFALPPGFQPLLVGLGIDPTAAIALMDMVSEPGLGVLADARAEDGYRLCNLCPRRQDALWVTLNGPEGGTISWRRREILMPSIPESAQACLVGRPLRELVSHPVLDAMDIGIVGFFECWDSQSSIEVVTTLHPDPY